VSEFHGEWCHWYVRHWPSKILIGFSKFFAAVKVNQLIISRRVIGGFVSWHAVESLRTGTKKSQQSGGQEKTIVIYESTRTNSRGMQRGR